MKNSKEHPQVFVCASAIGIYPITPRDQTFDEDSSGTGDNFASELCDKWEKAVDEAPDDVKLFNSFK